MSAAGADGGGRIHTDGCSQLIHVYFYSPEDNTIDYMSDEKHKK